MNNWVPPQQEKLRTREAMDEVILQGRSEDVPGRAVFSPRQEFATYEVEERPSIARYLLERTGDYLHNVYRAAQDVFYVHIPSWVKVHRAPFSHFGANLFGLAYTNTGDVHIRDDLEGDAFSEVLFHEVLHQLYPMNAEHEIRAMVRSRFGERAKIHHHLGPGH